MAAKITCPSSTFIDIQESSFMFKKDKSEFKYEFKSEFKSGSKEECKKEIKISFPEITPSEKTKLSTFQNTRILYLSEKLPFQICEIINSYALYLFEDISKGVPFARKITCRDIIFGTFSCCYLSPCLTNIPQLISELNLALEDENLEKATILYEQGVRWNFNFRAEVTYDEGLNCTEPPPFRLGAANKLILRLAENKNLISLYWLIKHSTISHTKRWRGISGGGPISMFAISWTNYSSDPIGHAFINILGNLAHKLAHKQHSKEYLEKYSKKQELSDRNARFLLLTAYLKEYPFEYLSERKPVTYQGEFVALRNEPSDYFRYHSCEDSYLRQLITEHFRIAVKNDEYEILDLFFNGQKNFNVNRCIDFNHENGPQHFAFYHINSEIGMEFWLAKGLNPNTTRKIDDIVETLLDVAIINNNQLVIDLLLNNGAISSKLMG